MFLNNKYQKALDGVASVLNSGAETDVVVPEIFKEIQAIFKNEAAYIFFLNPNGMSLKYFFGAEDADKNLLQNLELTPDISRMIVDKKSFVEQKAESIFSKFFKPSSSMQKSYLVSPLRIRNSVFGILVIEKYGAEQFLQEDIRIADAFSSVVSYIIKDAELSDVFKMQVKILQENISERAKAQKIIEEQNRQILETSKIKDDFLANVSHELRTPLTAIIGFSDALMAEIFGKMNEKQAEYVREINSGAVHLLGLLNGILDMSKIESKQMPLNYMNFDVKSSIDEVLNVVKTLAEKKDISINRTYPEESVQICADFKKFQQIVYNLLSNAIKYNNRGGKINISFSFDDKALRVSVQDNGIGIAEKDFEKIFEKFQQVENIYTKTESSTGLGLTITKEFVEMQGGKIWLESKLDEGSTFIFEIPLNQAV